MAENTDLAAIQKQLATIQDRLKELDHEDAVPKWWTKHQGNVDQRVSKLENRMDTTQGYLEQILHAVKAKAGEITPDKPTSSATKPQPGQASKFPPVVTILDEHERYTFNPEGPGILQNPTHTFTPQQKQKMKVEDTVPDGNNNEQHMPNLNHQSRGSNFRPKIELQMFDGNNPRG
ncbi:hypothetical protein HRI_004243900 [Hibiscus trionum]|uniref:Uncharacterized protein n=1 Tax=Hibiscus trionum TaxID=183268 RepID=A0A9W7J315_HIBTR|nr:hypothetical protein HRI_004243900 [Hibiscus trionum]